MRRRPTLPHPLECSTIGAVSLSFRVRDGTGRFPHAITTANLPPPHTHRGCAWKPVHEPTTHHHQPTKWTGWLWDGVVPKPYSGRETRSFTPQKGAARHVVCVKIIGLLVLVSSTSRQSSLPHPAYQPSSLLGASPPQRGRKSHLEASFPLRCFQRLSLPNVANQPCTWRYN